jgi:hypothetical protein
MMEQFCRARAFERATTKETEGRLLTYYSGADIRAAIGRCFNIKERLKV